MEKKILWNLMNNNLEKKSYEILWITIWKKNLWNLMNNNLEKNLMKSYEQQFGKKNLMKSYE